MAQLQESISDSDLICRLSLGLTNQVALLARGITDALSLNDFNQYCVQLLNCANALSSFNQTSPDNSRKLGQNSASGQFQEGVIKCSRCGESHDIKACSRIVRYPCAFCHKLDHFTRICPKNKHNFKLNYLST